MIQITTYLITAEKKLNSLFSTTVLERDGIKRKGEMLNYCC